MPRPPSAARILTTIAAVLALGSLPALAADGDGEGPRVRLRPVVDGLAVPVALAQPDDGTDRLFVVDQAGTVMVSDGDGGPAEPFLELGDRIIDIDPEYDERGVLGLAFHPGYATNGRFFVHYSAPLRDQAPDNWDHTSHISEFTVSADDPERADPDSERIVLQIDQPYSNHNGGQMVFGNDGYLYLTVGDGGNAGDRDAEGDDRGRPEDGNGQTVETILGSVLRIDVDGDEPYEVPGDNPFVDTDGADEIFAYGFRNPYGLSVDRETGDLYASDAGQARYEEVNLVEPGGNHGWNIREGTHCFDPEDFLADPTGCPTEGADGEPLIDPVAEYERGPESGSVVVPAVRYRGDRVPGLAGSVVFGDYATVRFLPTGVVYAAEETAERPWPVEQVSLAGRDGLGRFLLGVGQDLDGELYLLTSEEGGPTGTSGEVLAIDPPGATAFAAWDAVWIAAGAGAVAGVIGVVVYRMRRRTDRGEPT